MKLNELIPPQPFPAVKEKEDLHPDLESQGMNDDTFCEYRYCKSVTSETLWDQLSGNITFTHKNWILEC